MAATKIAEAVISTEGRNLVLRISPFGRNDNPSVLSNQPKHLCSMRKC